MTKSLIGTVLILTLLGKFSLSMAMDCSPLEPNMGVDKEVKNHLEGNINVLFKKLGSAEFKNEYQKIEKNVLTQFPNSDRLLMWNTQIYLLCTQLDSSTELSDNEKLKAFQWLVTTWQNGPPESKEGSGMNK
jgi:hypothetical protein